MTARSPDGPSRRRLCLSAATALGAACLPALCAAGPDQGIGGTGARRPVEEESDRGIGGTGVIGTIRKFGSIFVNDLRIAYPENVAVFVDGRPASVAALKIGQVVRVVANRDATGFSTQTIDVSSEVVGRVERVGAKNLTVLGQVVSTTTLNAGQTFAVGDHIAVSGLRRTDGTIVASLIERHDGDLYKVVGPVVQAPDGTMRIGGQKLSGVAPDLIGQRAIVIGQPSDGVLAVSRSTSETALFPAEVRRLKVEAYVERRGKVLRLGSGLVVGGTTSRLPEGRAVRAVLDASVGANGRLAVESLQSGGSRYQAAPREGGALERGQGGTRPMDFGRSPTNGRDVIRDLNESHGAGHPGSSLGGTGLGSRGGGLGLGGRPGGGRR